MTKKTNQNGPQIVFERLHKRGILEDHAVIAEPDKLHRGAAFPAECGIIPADKDGDEDKIAVIESWMHEEADWINM